MADQPHVIADEIWRISASLQKENVAAPPVPGRVLLAAGASVLPSAVAEQDKRTQLVLKYWWPMAIFPWKTHNHNRQAMVQVATYQWKRRNLRRERAEHDWWAESHLGHCSFWSTWFAIRSWGLVMSSKIEAIDYGFAARFENLAQSQRQDVQYQVNDHKLYKYMCVLNVYPQ
jgi:hypothetical protein